MVVKAGRSSLRGMSAAPIPPRMRAIVQDRFGTSQTLQLREVDVPTPDETSVLVKIRFASINALDWRTMTGTPFIGRLFAFGFFRPKRAIRGVDLSGEIMAIGKKDSRFHIGDAVFGLGSGSFAEFACANEAEITLKPSGVPFDQASTLGVAAFTALQAVRDFGKVQAGQSVLILGAGSGVGTFAVQLAKWRGANVTAVTSTRNVALVQSIGADAIIDYTRTDFTKESREYDCIIDISGLNSLSSSIKRVTPNGIFVLVGARGGFGRFIHAALLGRFGRRRIVAFIAQSKPEDLSQLGELVAQGRIRPVITQTYRLEDTPQAMGIAEQHSSSGKLVISMG
jgi:2-desacetyl-2-hydroxyethyl bacteriochlorophyllide A dehydrogenase